MIASALQKVLDAEFCRTYLDYGFVEHFVEVYWVVGEDAR